MSFDYNHHPDAAQRREAANLIDAGAQLAAILDRKKLDRSCVLVAPAGRSTVVGVAAVKKPHCDFAEIGYLIVRADFRRRGISSARIMRSGCFLGFFLR